MQFNQAFSGFVGVGEMRLEYTLIMLSVVKLLHMLIMCAEAVISALKVIQFIIVTDFKM